MPLKHGCLLFPFPRSLNFSIPVMFAQMATTIQSSLCFPPKHLSFLKVLLGKYLKNTSSILFWTYYWAHILLKTFSEMCFATENCTSETQALSPDIIFCWMLCHFLNLLSHPEQAWKLENPKFAVYSVSLSITNGLITACSCLVSFLPISILHQCQNLRI